MRTVFYYLNCSSEGFVNCNVFIIFLFMCKYNKNWLNHLPIIQKTNFHSTNNFWYFAKLFRTLKVVKLCLKYLLSQFIRRKGLLTILFHYDIVWSNERCMGSRPRGTEVSRRLLAGRRRWRRRSPSISSASPQRMRAQTPPPKTFSYESIRSFLSELLSISPLRGN